MSQRPDYANRFDVMKRILLTRPRGRGTDTPAFSRPGGAGLIRADVCEEVT